jgi:tetratricopeptide (TPR) repeat protein
LHRYASATLLHAAAARIFREMSDQAGEAGALLALGQIACTSREFSTAEEHLKAALELHRRTGNQAGEADALVGLGRVRVETSRYASADEDLRAALKLYRRAGNQRGEDDVLFWLGELERMAADMGIAGELFGRFDKAGVLIGLGMAALGSSGAAEEFRKALAIAREAGDEYLQAAALAGLGHVALIAHDDQAAADHYRAALELYRGDGDWYGRYKEAAALNDMGDVARAFGHHETACGRWREALAIYHELGTSSAASSAALAAGLVRDKIEQTCPE